MVEPKPGQPGHWRYKKDKLAEELRKTAKPLSEIVAPEGTKKMKKGIELVDYTKEDLEKKAKEMKFTDFKKFALEIYDIKGRGIKHIISKILKLQKKKK